MFLTGVNVSKIDILAVWVFFLFRSKHDPSTSIQWRQIILKVRGGGGGKYICITSMRAQQAWITAGGPGGGGRCKPQRFFPI